jgi:hypothetical protein
MRRRRTKPACMVRRRSTVRFRNGAPLKDQVRSSLDSSHPTPRMGVVAVLGGIWEIVFCASHGRSCSSGPTERARSARKAQSGRCRAPRRSEPGVTRWNQTRRRPCRVLSEITRASQLAPSPAFPVTFIVRWRGIFGVIWPDRLTHGWADAPESRQPPVIMLLIDWRHDHQRILGPSERPSGDCRKRRCKSGVASNRTQGFVKVAGPV